MAADTDLHRRVKRLENDTTSIYALIAEIQSTLKLHTGRFTAIDKRLASMDHRFDAIDQRLDGIDQRFDGMDRRFDGIETVLKEVVRRLPEPA